MVLVSRGVRVGRSVCFMREVFDPSHQRPLKRRPRRVKKSSRCELASASREPCARLGRMKKVLASRPASRASALTVGAVAPAAAVGIALVFGSRNLAAATSLALLAVVVAGAVAGLGSGIVASFLSFLGLNFFFTEPHHTLAVRHASDVVALVAFLLSALIVGALVSKVREERSRAERRATEARLLNTATERFISSEPLGRHPRWPRRGAPGAVRTRERRDLHTERCRQSDGGRPRDRRQDRRSRSPSKPDRDRSGR